MSAVLASVSVVPVLATASLAAEQVTQLVLGEGARVLGHDRDMLHVRTLLDECEGWLHRGYVHETTLASAETWIVNAAWSEYAGLSVGGVPITAPHRARLPLEGNERVRLPDGRPAQVVSGRLRPWGAVMRDAQQVRPAEWAWREFAGAPYLWGGVSAGGIDCSGLVQTTFLTRGVPLPRDARDQVAVGAVVELDRISADDLLYFRGAETEKVTHVAIAVDADTIVHSTVATGQVTREPWTAGSHAAPLRERLVAVRRLT